ncbi:hypothetical protein NHQ30_005473 [Ciborinia camelliae]|nr:hypothetical protein NHQ30_005473 [Ciborinia camelliae]
MALPRGESQVRLWYVESASNALKLPAHPIEEHLEEATAIMFKDSHLQIQVEKFKQCRSKLLKYLENYYQRIRTCSARINVYIEIQNSDPESVLRGLRVGLFAPITAEKISSGEFRIEPYCDRHVFTEGIVLLEEYAASFKRDLPYENRLAIRPQKRAFDQRYEQLPREQFLREIDRAYEELNYVNFVTAFKNAVADMDKQYGEIQQARRELFKWDVMGETGSDIVVDTEISNPSVGM